MGVTFGTLCGYAQAAPVSSTEELPAVNPEYQCILFNSEFHNSLFHENKQTTLFCMWGFM